MLLTFPSGPVMVNIQLPKNVIDVNLNKYLSTTCRDLVLLPP